MQQKHIVLPRAELTCALDPSNIYYYPYHNILSFCGYLKFKFHIKIHNLKKIHLWKSNAF